ncbi:hypothetical protein D3C83_06390 [compost metagenome]
MDGGRIERVVAADDAQEAGRLLERPLAEPRDVENLPAVAEGAVLVAERDDVLGQRAAQARDAREERGRSRIHVGANRVHAVLDDGIELPCELPLIDIVLVLPDADRLRLDPNELGERILQAAGDRHGAPQRYVQVGKLPGRQLGGGIHRRARL